MTEARRKYLNSISKEERAIREEISYKKSLIQLFKMQISIIDNNELKKQVAREKLIIKALKKQLPVEFSMVDGSCPICSFPHDDCAYVAYYCCRCGRKLR